VPGWSKVTDIEAAWLAGLLEGEGCFRRSECNAFQISLEMTDKDIVERAAKLMNGRVYQRKMRKEHWKTQWHVHVGADNGKATLLRILPFMGERRTQKINEILNKFSHRLTPVEVSRRAVQAQRRKRRDTNTLSLGF
jgi:hypothetical protein